MKLADEITYIHEELPFKKAIVPIDDKLNDNPTPFELSTLLDTLLNMLKRYPKKKSEIKRRLKNIEIKLRKVL